MKHKNTIGDTCADIAIYFILIAFALLCVFPFYYMFINTISSNTLSSAGKILFYPKDIHFNNYIRIFQLRGLPNALLISVLRTAIGTVLTLLGSSFLGYTLSKKKMWKRKFWYRFVIITMYFNAGIIPWYLTMKTLGMINSFYAYILPYVVTPFYLILFKTYIESYPPELEEAALIDGANYFNSFCRIIFPMSSPILATIAVFTSVDQWNMFTDTLFLINDQKLFTLQYILYQYLSEASALAQIIKRTSSVNISAARMLTTTAVQMTISIVVVLPILFVYPFFQRFFVKGIMIGAVKG